MRDLKHFFQPKSIAVIGASRNLNKIGHILYKNIIDGKFQGEVFPVNITGEEVLGKKSFLSVLNIKEKIDLAIIAIPAIHVLKVLRDCKKKGIKNILIISAGFREIGNISLEDKLINFLKKNKMNCIGVNCLGIFDAYNNLDAIFIPRLRLKRPEKGNISFVCQSGAVGAALLDIASENDHKFSKFISYGNATDIDESDIIEYLGNDDNTKVISLYFEGIKNGNKFFSVLKNISQKKPIIAIKGGLTKEGSMAVLSHTGSLAGNKEVFYGVFNQTNVITAESLEELFLITSLFEKIKYFKGNNIQVITNGGGYGIISTDAIIQSKYLKLANLSELTKKNLRKQLPEIISIKNPLDLLGDATTKRYEIALENCIKDKNIDLILLIVLYQTPLISQNIVELISSFKEKTNKPVIVVSTGGDFTQNLSERLVRNSIPVFSYPEDSIKALDKMVWYLNKINKINKR